MTAVIVGSDAIFSRMLELELEGRGVSVSVAGDFASAAEKKPNVIFLDAGACRAVPKAPDGCDVVIIGAADDIASLGEEAYDFPVYERPFVVSDMLDATVGVPSLTSDAVKMKKSVSDGLRLHASSHSATYRGEHIDLSKKEFLLLQMLIEKKGAPVPRDEASEKIFGGGGSNVVDVYVKYLREKIDERFGVKLICSVRGKGYVIK